MASLLDVLATWSPWATVAVLAATVLPNSLREIGYWSVERKRLGIVQSLLASENSDKAMLRAHLDKLLAPTPRPTGRRGPETARLSNTRAKGVSEE